MITNSGGIAAALLPELRLFKLFLIALHVAQSRADSNIAVSFRNKWPYRARIVRTCEFSTTLSYPKNNLNQLRKISFSKLNFLKLSHFWNTTQNKHSAEKQDRKYKPLKTLHFHETYSLRKKCCTVYFVCKLMTTKWTVGIFNNQAGMTHVRRRP